MTTSLKSRLEGCQRLALLGIGSELRADDGAGILVVRRLRSLVFRQPFNAISFEGFEGGTAPENTTGFISSFRPTHIVLVDAADIGGKPGEFREILPHEIPDISFSTHTLPLAMLMEYMARSTGALTTVIGIQPENLGFDIPVSPPVRKGVTHLCDLLHGVLAELDQRAT